MLQSICTVNKFEQYLYCESFYKKISNGELIAEETEEMYILWYYRYEMELILEKIGFHNISYNEAILRAESHMIFIAEKLT